MTKKPTIEKALREISTTIEKNHPTEVAQLQHLANVLTTPKDMDTSHISIEVYTEKRLF